MRIHRVLAPALASGVLVAACGGSAPSAQSGSPAASGSGTIKIGSLHPLSGGLAFDGQQQDNGVKLAVADLNAAGGIKALGGAKLEVVSGDSQGKPDIGQSESTRLLQQGAVALVGPYQSAVASNVAAVVERNQVPLVIDVAVADSILNQGYKYTFRLQPDASSMGTEGARYLKQLADQSGTAVTKVAFVHEQSDFGTSVYKAFAAEAGKLGLTVGPEIAYDAASASDLTAQITQVKASGADVLAVAGYYRDGVLLAKNVASVAPNLKAVYGVADGAFDLAQFPKDVGQPAEGYFDANYHLDVTNPQTQKVAQDYQAKFGAPIRTEAVLSYDAVRVIAAGLEKDGSRDPKKLRDAIAATNL
jgi:branched-chain amino acid transport system substrate-binding protein